MSDKKRPPEAEEFLKEHTRGLIRDIVNGTKDRIAVSGKCYTATFNGCEVSLYVPPRDEKAAE
jgi:hypothetical protein